MAPVTAAPFAITTRSPTLTSRATVKCTGLPSSAVCGMSSAKLIVKGTPSVKVTATMEPDAETGVGVGFGTVVDAGGADAGVVATGVGSGVEDATGTAGFEDAALGLRIASITVSGTLALVRRITSGAERLNAVFELRIWLRMTAGATFASTIWMT